MTIIVHIRQATLWYRDWPLRKEEASFEPLPEATRTRPSGVLIERPASRPVRVKVPVGSKVQDGRLVAHCCRLGWDATTVLYAARRGIEGCRIEPEAPPPALEPGHWAVLFRASLPSGCLCFAALEGGSMGDVESTLDPDRARTWPTRETAQEWLRSIGLDERRPVPIGSPGWLYPVVEPFDPVHWRGVDFPRAVEFGLRINSARRGPGQAPARSQALQGLLFDLTGVRGPYGGGS